MSGCLKILKSGEMLLGPLQCQNPFHWHCSPFALPVAPALMTTIMLACQGLCLCFSLLYLMEWLMNMALLILLSCIVFNKLRLQITTTSTTGS